MKLKTLDAYLKEKSISSEQFDALTEIEKADHYDALNEDNSNMIKTAFEDGQKESVEAMQKEMREMYDSQFKTLNKALRDVAASVKASTEKVKEDQPTSVEFKELQPKMKAMLAGREHRDGLEVKAITNVASIATNTAGYDVPDVGQLATAVRNAYAIMPKISISDGQNLRKTINYWDWDEASIVRAADMVAEGGTFPESTAKWKQYTLPVQKVGDTIPVSEEFMEDEQMFYAELAMFLRTNIEIKINDQVVNGDGTGNNLTGMISSVPTYTPVAAGITDASIYDLIVKLRETISAPYGGKYNTNFALMNLTDINKMKLKKDANNNYMLPPFVDRSGNVVDGLTIVEDNTVVANTMFMGDSRFARIYERTGLDLAQGLVGSQFIEDAITLKVRKRMAFLIREVDKTGFLQVTDITAALVTLAS
jgi:HK97 family phage major capsid protein